MYFCKKKVKIINFVFYNIQKEILNRPLQIVENRPDDLKWQKTQKGDSRVLLCERYSSD